MKAVTIDTRTWPMADPRIFRLSPLFVGGAYLFAYVMLDWASFIHPYASFGITPWNPPPGLSFILILLFGQRFIPLLFVAPLLADLAVRQLSLPWPIELATVAVNGAGYAAGLLLLLRPGVRFNPALVSMRDMLLLMGIAAMSAAAVAAAYVAILVAGGILTFPEFQHAALQYWVGDLIGIAVVTPFGLILLTRGGQFRPAGETAIHLAAIAIIMAIVLSANDDHRFNLFYLLFLPVIWMAARRGLEGVTAGIVVAQLGLIFGLHLMSGPLPDITTFQALMLVLAATGLTAGMLVTEHRRTEYQLRLHQDSLAKVARLGTMGELAAAVAHELNQPLMAAGTYSRLVADTVAASPIDQNTAISTAAKAVAQVERAAEVVRRLRAFIRLDQSGRAPCPVDRVIRETVALCQPDLARNAIVLSVQVAPGTPHVMIDLLQIEQVLLNLLRNSIDAIAEKGGYDGRIAITVAPNGNDVEWQVTDNGPGFPSEVLTTEIAPMMMSTKPDGIGLGLPLCRSIVEAHRGRLELRPPSTVVFTVPVAERVNG